ncbi:Uncharacterized membrane protein YesL [Evansella caseinilytica]|uniref:Uncharacterized membrane protein YesL n=1 Tax=Evansella caseinilytica TaxID=1503961 RepID=A0A1H3INB8_9BACI|nr:YesL family protein [Evansella caseinilytica]SDY28314.1 Uncharacterized membrane protein YesL [Evansella caseinilytica]
MQPSWMASKFYRTCEWVWKLAYLNLLWLLFSLLGFVVIGIFPATAAMFAVLRKWFLKDTDVPVFSTFFTTFKNNFFKVNLLGFLFAAVGYILYFNYQYLGTVDGGIHSVLAVGWYIGSFLYLLALLFVFPVYVHYELKLLHYLKAAVIIAAVNPLALATLFVSLGLLFYLFYLIPGLIPFFGASVFGLSVMWCAHMSFQRLERKKQKLAAV